MAVCSYVAYPRGGRGASLSESLNRLAGCEATAAEDGSLVLVVTETADRVEEQRLQEALAAVDELELRVLTFGSVEEGRAGA